VNLSVRDVKDMSALNLWPGMWELLGQTDSIAQPVKQGLDDVTAQFIDPRHITAVEVEIKDLNVADVVTAVGCAVPSSLNLAMRCFMQARWISTNSEFHTVALDASRH
jgi:hypothetical protein